MKLSDAIRAGSKVTKQHFGDLFKIRYGDIGYTCALGAAALGAGEGIEPNSYAITQRFPELYNHRDVCPVCNDTLYNQTLFFLISHLNDEHHWKREAIADWLDEMTLDLTPVAISVEAAA